MAYFYFQIEQQQRILQCVQAILPESLAKQAKHCLIRGKRLLIYTDSPAWASQLRFYSGTLIAAMTLLMGRPIEIVQVRIIAGQTGLVSRPKRKANLPSAEKIAIIRNDSLNVADNELSLALLKLSSTLARASRGA
jgi:hypothetical protein